MFSRSYQPLHNKGTKEAKIYLKFKTFTLLTCSLPIFGFFFCIIYSITYNFRSATATGCGAFNLLPSISAAIGGFSPQKEVWQTAIFLDFIPRLILIFIFVEYNVGNSQVQIKSNVLVYLLAGLTLVENCALVLLSFYDSTHSYSIHEVSFIAFVLTSQMYMLLLIWYKFQRGLSKSEQYGLKLRIWLAGSNIIAILFAMYYFILHNKYCQDYTYTKFALCEYVVVLTNIAFHATIIFDFPYRKIVFSRSCNVFLEETHPYQLVTQASDGSGDRVRKYQ